MNTRSAKAAGLVFGPEVIRYNQAADEVGIRVNTVVMFTSDNGTTYPVKVTKPAPKGYAKVTGIRGARHRSYLPEGKPAVPDPALEGPLTRTDHGDIPGGKDLMSHRGVHVPLIVDWPRYRANYKKIGHRNDGLVDFTDFVPTLCELAGAKMPNDRTMDGKSLVSALKGESSETDRDVAFCHYWFFGRQKDRARTAVHNKRWKLYDNGDFFDLQADAEEEHPVSIENLKPETRRVHAHLKKRMDQILVADKRDPANQPRTVNPNSKSNKKPAKQHKPKPTAPNVKANAQNQPNVVLIFADDMGWGDVGFHGYKDVLTPNIDRIATEGVHFPQGYVSASVCGPSRAGLMTGVYQQRVGAGENASATGYPDRIPERIKMSGLPTSQPTIAEMLRPTGYRCGMIGKWHLGVEKPLRPHHRGFNFFLGFLNGSHDYTAWDNRFAQRKDKWPLFRNDRMLPPAEDVYLTDLFSDRAVSFINHNTEKPFFLYLAYNAVHHPWQVPEKYLDPTKHLSDVEDRRFFAGMSRNSGAGTRPSVTKTASLASHARITTPTTFHNPTERIT